MNTIIPKLRSLLALTNSYARLNVLQTLASLKDVEQIPALQTIADSGGTDSYAALDALRMHNASEAIPALTKAAQDSNPTVHTVIESDLNYIGASQGN